MKSSDYPQPPTSKAYKGAALKMSVYFVVLFFMECIPLSLGSAITPGLPPQASPQRWSISNNMIMPHNATVTAESSIDLILSFWFDPRFPYTRWFVPNPELDAEITTKFGNLVSTARTTTSLDYWAESSRGCLALILLLDQFPRNIFRKSADAYMSDFKALSIATSAIAQGLDRRVPLVQQAFYYLPFEHEENLLSQIACVSFFEGFAGRCRAGTQEKGLADKCLDYAVRHKQVILEFDRFPGRNAVLHRQSTEEEIQFLKTHPQGF